MVSEQKIVEQRGLSDRRIGSRRRTVLVEDWRAAWKWISIHISAALAFFAVAYEFLPAVKEYVPAKYLPYVMILAAVGVVAGRLKAQK